MHCCTLNVQQGDCLKSPQQARTTVSERVPCSGAEREVDEVLEGKKLCSDPASSVAYSNPVRTICLSKL